ncbi:hypothetical protein BH10BAC5_BH10BAC5_00910 [soil metagenome]
MGKKLLIILGGIIVVFFLFNSVLMPWYVKQSDTATVPNVLGLNYIDAKKKLESVGLELKQGDVRYDENKPIGEILDQNPPAGQVVKYGRRIYLTICGGEQLVEVPNLVGRSIRDAKFSLEQRNLLIGETVRKSSGQFKEDFVISQILQPGSKVKKQSKIDLIISDGMILGELKVPDVMSKNLEEAKKIITDSKLKLGKITYQVNNDLAPGKIVDQYPKGGRSANENTSIDLFVSKKQKVVEKPVDTDEPGDIKAPKDNTKENIDEPKEKDKSQPPIRKEILKDKTGDGKKPDPTKPETKPTLPKIVPKKDGTEKPKTN